IHLRAPRPLAPRFQHLGCNLPVRLHRDNLHSPRWNSRHGEQIWRQLGRRTVHNHLPSKNRVSMTYAVVSTIRQDPWIRDRVAACIALETSEVPEQWVVANAWALAAMPGWADAWGLAVDRHANIAGY